MDTLLNRILLVEDDPQLRAVAAATLEFVGKFSVLACESAALALEALDEFGPQLVLSDVMMPGIDGVELLARLRTRYGEAAVPLVFMTAKLQPHQLQELQALQPLGVIAKPFDVMHLPEQLKTLWRLRKQ